MDEKDEDMNSNKVDFNDTGRGEEEVKCPELSIQPGETVQGSGTSYRVIRRIGQFLKI